MWANIKSVPGIQLSNLSQNKSGSAGIWRQGPRMEKVWQTAASGAAARAAQRLIETVGFVPIIIFKKSLRRLISLTQPQGLQVLKKAHIRHNLYKT